MREKILHMRLIGVISDTHGLLRPQAADALRGADLIVHAGDIGSEQVLRDLRAIAPVVAVRGNNDRQPWAETIAETQTIDVNGSRIHVLHDLGELAIDLGAAGIGVVITGHSHRPAIEWRDAVLFLNPGSAGPRRFSLPIAVAHLHVAARPFHAEIVDLER